MIQQQPKSAAHGLLLADKPPGLTSHDVVERFRRRSAIRKVGHTGTLDPLATGLLVLCVGKATRLQAFLMKLEKTYQGTIQFGWATDSYDASGAPLSEAREVSVEHIDFASLVPRFLGEIDQTPPQFSAKKVAGVRAYELARKGEVADLKPRRVTVYEFDILGVSGSTMRFRVRSSAGTYVRSLAHELGQAAGVAAHLRDLRRTAIGKFRVDDAIAFDRLAGAPVEEVLGPPHFQPLSAIDLPLEKLRIDWSQEQKMLRGQAVIMMPAIPVRQGDLIALGNPADQLVAIGEVINVLQESGPIEVRPRVVLRGE